MCGYLAKWVSVVERLGEGRLRGLLGPYPSMTDAIVPLAEAPFPFNLIGKMMEPVQVVPAIGAGVWVFWRR